MSNERERESGRGKRPPYDPNADVEYAIYKARDEKLGEGIVMQLMSYKGAEPRIKLTRYYKDREGKWVPDVAKACYCKEGRAHKHPGAHEFPRFRIIVLSWLLTGSREMDRGYDEWERANHRKHRPDSAPAKAQRPDTRQERAERDRGRK